MDQETQMEPRPSAVLPVVLSVLLSALVFGGLGYYLAGSYPLKKPASPTPPAQPTTSAATYRNAFVSLDYLGFNFQVPTTWSIYDNSFFRDFPIPSDKLTDEPGVSVSEKNVYIGDFNPNQVDFHVSTGDIAARLVTEAKKEDSQHWTKETVGGITADVYTHPLENGQVSKGGTGGKDYYLSVAGANVSFGGQKIRTLVIRKQAQGETSFEGEFDHLIKSFQIAE